MTEDEIVIIDTFPLQKEEEEHDNKLNYLVTKTKILLEYELQESSSSYQNLAEEVVDGYNKAHSLKVKERKDNG